MSRLGMELAALWETLSVGASHQPAPELVLGKQ